MTTWHKAIITLGLTSGPDKHIAAITCEGLAIHRAYRRPGWTISHAQSGMHIDGEFTTRQAAQEKAEQWFALEGLWLKPLDELIEAVKAYKRIEETAEKLLGPGRKFKLDHANIRLKQLKGV
jgi:hypothetical protein